jgi:transposase-like protein
MIVPKRRDTGVAVRFLRRLLKNQHVEPEVIVTDGLRSYGAALQRLGLSDRHRPGRPRDNNHAENSHLSIRRRERKMQGFKSRASAEPRSLAFTTRTLGICLEQGSRVTATGWSKAQQNRTKLI